MPRGVGTFIRTNGQYDGSEVWQDDLENNVKIIALRHDTHDQDLANGIAECLPKSGLEPMLGNLQMGAFLIKNLGYGTVPADGAAFGQVVNSAIFDEPSRTLTLGRAGLPPLAVTIQSGGDNTIITTGVQEVIIGSGLNLTGDSLGGNALNEGNPKGTVELSNTGVSAGTYNNANISVDAKGRITSATSGASGLANLSTSYGQNFVTIVNDAGNNATINEANASLLRAGVMSAAAKTKLDALDAALYAKISGGNQLFGNQILDGNVEVLNFSMKMGLSAIPSLLFQGIEVQSNGSVLMPNLPTSASGLLTGQLWNNGGTLSIV